MTTVWKLGVTPAGLVVVTLPPVRRTAWWQTVTKSLNRSCGVSVGMTKPLDR